MQRTPIWWFSILPLNTLYMKVFVPLFNRFAAWLAFTVDWKFWHDFVHNNLIRDMFVNFADFLANIIDAQGVDGAVNGVGKVTRDRGERPAANSNRLRSQLCPEHLLRGCRIINLLLVFRTINGN